MTGWPTQDAQRPLPGVPGYRVTRVIGEGGMSTVYLGTQLSLGREVAIKVMRPEALADEVSRRRFENEARTIARLEHPHIVGIHEVGRTDDGLPWYAMPHLARGHVGQRDLTGDPQRVREILRALLSALAFAHARGTIHRDVKAENVLFDEADRPLLADFGIALRRGHGTRVTMTGLAVGSTAYMAPEQARGQQVDHRADLYSVGVLAWEMLTGELPYKADDALSMAIQHTQNPIPRLPPALRHWQKFFDRAMAKSPRKRFADAAQMLEALERIPVHQRSRGPDPREVVARMRDRLVRVPRAAWVALALVLAAALGLGMHGRSPSDAGTGAGPDRRTAAPAPADGPAADGSEGAPTADATPAGAAGDMLAAAPLSAADRLLDQARAQVAAGRLAAPARDNAADSLVEAARADPTHPQLVTTATRVSDALRDASVRAIARDRASDLDLLLRAAARVQATGAVPDAARASWRTRVGEAIEARAERAVTRVDRATALRMADAADTAGVPEDTVRQLRARAERLPDLQGRDPGNLDGMKVLEGTARPLAAYLKPVTRGDYARFTEATGREPTLCRERASLLRMVSPRDWSRPGFEQGDGDPVVCVSVADVEAYAQWFGRRDGHRYRLPTATEAAGLPAAGGRALSEWRADCAADCAKRRASGASFRSDEASRMLDADRGYDDVGFRLVREL